MAADKTKSHTHEREHAHRQEADFKRLARRNKLFGLWAAKELGYEGEAADAYARDVIYSDLDEPGEDDMFRKVTADFERHGKKASREMLMQKLAESMHRAEAEK